MYPDAGPPFSFQIGAPRVNDLRGRTACDVQEAIVEMFPYNTERLVIFWNSLPIPFTYKYEVSDYIDIFVEMCHELVSNAGGTTRQMLASNAMNVTWDVSWLGDDLRVDANWALMPHEFETRHPGYRSLAMRKSSFLAEWAVLMRGIERAVEQSGVQLEDPRQLEAMRELCETIESSYGLRGYLYS